VDAFNIAVDKRFVAEQPLCQTGSVTKKHGLRPRSSLQPMSPPPPPQDIGALMNRVPRKKEVVVVVTGADSTCRDHPFFPRVNSGNRRESFL